MLSMDIASLWRSCALDNRKTLCANCPLASRTCFVHLHFCQRGRQLQRCFSNSLRVHEASTMTPCTCEASSAKDVEARSFCARSASSLRMMNYCKCGMSFHGLRPHLW